MEWLNRPHSFVTHGSSTYGVPVESPIGSASWWVDPWDDWLPLWLAYTVPSAPCTLRVHSPSGNTDG